MTQFFNKDRTGPNVNVLIFTLKQTTDNSAFPVFLGYNFNSNHTVHTENRTRIRQVWLWSGILASPTQWADSLRERLAARK